MAASRHHWAAQVRIAFFVPRSVPDNSHGRYVTALAERLAREHVVEVFTGATGHVSTGAVRWRRLPVLNRPAPARLAGLWLAATVVRAVSERFDIIHTQGADAPGTVVTAMCCVAAMRPAGVGDRGPYRHLISAIAARLERHCMRRAAVRGVIAVSSKVRAEVRQNYGVVDARIRSIPLGVDVQRFQPDGRGRDGRAIRERLGVGDGDFLVVYVGGDYRLKGLLVLLASLRLLPPHVCVLAVGVTPDARLARLAAESGRPGRVICVPRTVDIAPYYAAADAFALPTMYDTFSLATVEAMASGLPVVVSAEAGVAEHLTDGSDALVLRDPRDHVRLAEQLGALVSEPALRAHLGENGRRTAERFSWDRIALETLSAYREFCQRA